MTEKEKRANQLLLQQKEEVKERLKGNSFLLFYIEQEDFLSRKRSRMDKYVKSMEQAEFENITQQINSIEDKHRKSQMLHEKMINKRVDDMRNKNLSTFGKLQEYKERYEKDYEEK